jgi:N-acetylglutamate synthase-like GNAT family acetyltransferase
MDIARVVFRPAQPQDAWAIRHLIWKVRINPAGLDWRHFIVAVDDQGRLLGCGQLKPHTDGSREMASIAVQPQQRSRGIASAMIERLLAEAGRPLYLKCADRMQKFYEKFGFQVIMPEEMPPTFRREWQQVDWVSEHLLQRRVRLLVMRLD